MRVDRLINVLSEITLIEMMVTIGFSDVLRVSRNYGRVARAVLANYMFVPAAALGLLLLFHASPMIGVGLLVAALCPGAPYGPPFTAMAKGNVVVSVGLMVILAGSSAIIAPTSVRNVCVSLVIVTGSFPGTPAIGSATAYALFQTIVIALVALAWSRLAPADIDLVKMKAA